MLAPIIFMVAGGGFLLYLLSGGSSASWKVKWAEPGDRYFFRVKVTPPVEWTTADWRSVLTSDGYRVLMLDYSGGYLQAIIQYSVRTPIYRVLKMPAGDAGTPTTLTIEELQLLTEDSRQYPDMPVALLPGAEAYMPPVKAPDNLRHIFANALYSQNPTVMRTAARNLRTLGWPGLAEPLEQRANQS